MYNTVLLPLFEAFTDYVPAIPKMYWDVYSQEERIRAICDQIDKIIAYANTLGIQINTNTEDIEQLMEEFEEFKESGFDDYYKQIIQAWVSSHMPDIMEQATKMVFFEINDDGYFVANIPEQWDDIEFDTGMNYDDQRTYGRLILRY